VFTAKIKNKYGEILELTHNPDYTIQSITGLGPVNAAINTTAIATVDGTVFNSSKKNKRNIVITVVIEGNIERNRLQLYKFAPTKYPITFYYKNDSRDVHIEGYVESHEVDLFKNRQVAQISIICPNPFFRNNQNNYIEFSNTAPNFEFPFSISDAGTELGVTEKSTEMTINAGEVETGGTISFIATTSGILNPAIYNRTTQKYFGLNVDMNSGDVITLCTILGKKSVTLLRAGTVTNLIDKVSTGSTWIQFAPNENEISYGADEGESNLTITVELTNQFEGV